MAERERRNDKAKKYAGQLCNVTRKDTVLSVIDKLSHVDDTADATYLELLHPAAVYRMNILGDISNGISVTANIRPEDVKRIWMRLEFAEKILFDYESGQVGNSSANESDGSEDLLKTNAFTVTFGMGKLKGKSPGGYLCEETDKTQAVKELQSQREFLEKNLQKYPANKKIIDAIDTTLEYYELGALDDTSMQSEPAKPTPNCVVCLYDPPEKTFRIDTKALEDGRVLTKCYKISILFDASKTYPYKISIRNRYGLIDKNSRTGLEVPRYVEKEVAEIHEYDISITSDEMISVIGAMMDNKKYYESNIYVAMRKADCKLQEENRKNWKPKNI